MQTETPDDVSSAPGAGTDTAAESETEADSTTGAMATGSADCGGLLLCDGFEYVAPGGAPDRATWSLVAGYTEVDQTDVVRVDSGQAHTGAQALRVDRDGLAGIFTAVAERQFFVRAFMRVDAAPLGPVLMGIGSDTQPQSEIRFRIQQSSLATINIVPGDAVLPQAARENNCPTCPVVPVDEWFCVEFAIDAQAQVATLWLNGTEVATARDGVGGWPDLPSPIPVRLGTMSLQGGEAGVWIDDVAIGTQRVGCD